MSTEKVERCVAPWESVKPLSLCFVPPTIFIASSWDAATRSTLWIQQCFRLCQFLLDWVHFWFHASIYCHALFRTSLVIWSHLDLSHYGSSWVVLGHLQSIKDDIGLRMNNFVFRPYVLSSVQFVFCTVCLQTKAYRLGFADNMFGNSLDRW